MNPRQRAIAGAATVLTVAVGFGLVACGADPEAPPEPMPTVMTSTGPNGDAITVPVEPSPAPGVITLPGGWGTIVTVCDHGNRVYYAGASNARTLWGVPADPTCKDMPQ